MALTCKCGNRHNRDENPEQTLLFHESILDDMLDLAADPKRGSEVYKLARAAWECNVCGRIAIWHAEGWGEVIWYEPSKLGVPRMLPGVKKDMLADAIKTYPSGRVEAPPHRSTMTVSYPCAEIAIRPLPPPAGDDAQAGATRARPQKMTLVAEDLRVGLVTIREILYADQLGCDAVDLSPPKERRVEIGGKWVGIKGEDPARELKAGKKAAKAKAAKTRKAKP